MIGGGEGIPRGPALSFGIPRRSWSRVRGGDRVGTGLLMLPIARSGPGGPAFVEALFTATSAVCVTGLTVVDTPAYWSGFGQAVILVLIQVGGFGIMTLASLLGLLVSRRMGLRSRLTAAAETKQRRHRRCPRGAARGRPHQPAGRGGHRGGADRPVRPRLRRAVPAGASYLGVFHAVSAFNNAGFALYSRQPDRVRRPTRGSACRSRVAVIVGGIGFPVMFELRRQLRRPRAVEPAHQDHRVDDRRCCWCSAPRS